MRQQDPSDRKGAGGVLRRALFFAPPLLATGCATPKRINAVPAGLTAQAEPLIPRVRYFPDRDPGPFTALAIDAQAKEAAWLKQSGHQGPLPPAAILAISGGGGDGAFGAGLLAGWTKAGDRPAFRLVTGVSTGALIAPFAFVGPKYDAVLHKAYTATSDSDIFKKRPFLSAIFQDALTDTGPMANLVDHYLTQEVLNDIAAEYAKGRVLLVGTTNLDAREPVYWDMGAIASHPGPEAMQLFRQIILASAAIPGLFPPVMIDVTVGGQRYQEMHVDGGATRQVFMYPQTLHLGDMAQTRRVERKRAIYILRNARLDPDWASVDRRILSILGRSVSSLIQTQGLGDLIRIYLTSMRDGIDYNLAYIPRDFAVPRRSEFDLDYMQQLFERGRTMAEKGYVWAKYPPGYEPVEPPRAD